MRKQHIIDVYNITGQQMVELIKDHYRYYERQFNGTTRYADRFRETINRILTWSNTPQGHDFWEAINEAVSEEAALEIFLRKSERIPYLETPKPNTTMETTGKVLLSDGAFKGTYVPTDEAIQLSSTIYDGLEGYPPFCHQTDDHVVTCSHSSNPNVVILLEDAVETTDGYAVHGIDRTEHDESQYHELPVLRNRLAEHDMVELHEGGWACSNSDEVYYGFVNEDYNGYWLGSREDYVEIRGDFYISDDVARDCGWLFNYDTDEYYKAKETLASYGEYDHPDHSDDSELTFGLEVEKMCPTAQQSIGHYDLYQETGYAKEEDGSCPSSQGGFELVSPIYSLNDLSRFVDEISNENIKKHFDAKFDDRFGGHITVAHKNMSAHEIFTSLMGYFPLLYALYPKRVTAEYSRARCKFRMFTNPEKRSSVYIKGGRLLEFRIFPAVRDTETAIWRATLLQIMMKNPNLSEYEVLKMITNRKSDLSKHLRSMYRRAEKPVDVSVLALTQRFVDYAKQYNSVTIQENPLALSFVKK
jgi:hypothetical protein